MVVLFKLSLQQNLEVIEIIGSPLLLLSSPILYVINLMDCTENARKSFILKTCNIENWILLQNFPILHNALKAVVSSCNVGWMSTRQAFHLPMVHKISNIPLYHAPEFQTSEKIVQLSQTLVEVHYFCRGLEFTIIFADSDWVPVFLLQNSRINERIQVEHWNSALFLNLFEVFFVHLKIWWDFLTSLREPLWVKVCALIKMKLRKPSKILN